MKKLTKISYCHVVLLLFVLLLAGCAGSTNEKTDNNSTSQTKGSSPIEKIRDKSESTKELKEFAIDDSNETSSENAQNANSDLNKEDNAKENNPKNEIKKRSSEKKTDIDQNKVQKNKDNSRTQSDNQDTEIKTDTPEKDQEKAISLVREYLRNKYDDFIEDKDNFLAYDGEIKDYIIVRDATLVSGHTSTNGRYAVDINSGEIADVTADPSNPEDFFNS